MSKVCPYKRNKLLIFNAESSFSPTSKHSVRFTSSLGQTLRQA
jgi:hypothetical protein